VIEDIPDHRRILDETDDSHVPLTFLTDQRIYLVYFLNQPGPTFPESLYVSLRFEDAGDGVLQTFLFFPLVSAYLGHLLQNINHLRQSNFSIVVHVRADIDRLSGSIACHDL
jgi:hypothetical protein